MFGLSSGGLITLECARILPAVRKAVVYEPAFYVHGLDHSGPWNVDRGGAPDVVARSMRSLLSDDRA